MNIDQPHTPEKSIKGIESFFDLRLTSLEHDNHPFFSGDYEKRKQKEYCVFEDGKSPVMLIGVDHFENIDHPSVKFLRKKFEEYRPDMVLVEGRPAGRIIRLRNVSIDKVKEVSDEQVISEGGEPELVLKCAIERGIDFDSPEPDRRLELKNNFDRGHSLENILSYYMMRSMTRFNRETAKDEILSGLDYVKSDFIEYGIDKNIVEDLMRKIIDRNFPINQDRIEYFRMCESPNTNVNKIKSDVKDKDKVIEISAVASETSAFRDRYLVQGIEKAMKDYDRVLVVYGRSHILMIEPVVRAYLDQFNT